jgi:hypothetical protein
MRPTSSISEEKGGAELHHMVQDIFAALILLMVSSYMNM